MWKLFWALSNKSVLFLALFHLLFYSQGNARYYLIESADETSSKTNSKNPNYPTENHDCYITVHETRRIGGQCVKIRENFHGCVAGSLMDPFHQDCL